MSVTQCKRWWRSWSPFSNKDALPWTQWKLCIQTEHYLWALWIGPKTCVLTEMKSLTHKSDIQSTRSQLTLNLIVPETTHQALQPLPVPSLLLLLYCLFHHCLRVFQLGWWLFQATVDKVSLLSWNTVQLLNAIKPLLFRSIQSRTNVLDQVNIRLPTMWLHSLAFLILEKRAVKEMKFPLLHAKWQKQRNLAVARGAVIGFSYLCCHFDI